MDITQVKKELLEALDVSLKRLDEIPVTAIRDCRRKTAICDNILAVRKVLAALEFKDKENTDEREAEDTQTEG